MTYKQRYQLKNKRRAIFADIISIFAMLGAVIGIWIGAANIQYYPVRSTIVIMVGFYIMGKIFTERDILEETDD